MKYMNIERRSLIRHLALAAFLGGCSLAWARLTLGPRPFELFNTEWLAGDLSQVYYAWIIFMREPWSNGLSTSMLSTPLSLAISLFDAMPLLALLAKPFQFIIPDGSQYFGIYFTFCIALQGFLGYQIAHRVLAYSGKPAEQQRAYQTVICLAGAVFCMTAPSVMNRFTAHTALSSQWLLLLAILVSLRWSAAPIAKWALTHGGTLIVATGINPYLALFVIINFSVFTFVSLRARGWKSVAAQMGILASTGIVGLWFFGFITGALPGGGYGLYSMNALGPFDSNGFGTIWHIDIPDATSGQSWEGFAYLGFGSIAMLAISAGIALLTKKRGEFPFLAAWVVVICVFLLSLSNTVTVANWRFVIPLPEFLVSSLSLFRASGRFFWIGGFWLIFLSMAVIVQRLDRRIATSLIVVCAMLQVIDVVGIADMTKSKIDGLHRLRADFTPVLKSGETASRLLIYPPWQCDPHASPTGVRSFEIFNAIVANHQIPTNSFYTGRTPTNQFQYHCDFKARFTIIDPAAVYVVSDAIWQTYGERLSKTHLCAQDIALNSTWVCR
jgi:hypothetical protein